MSKAIETDFFKQVNILLTKKHKDHLVALKQRTTLSNNIAIDNSCFVRAMIEYLYEHPDTCDNIKKYIIQNKGATYLTKFEVLINEGKTPNEVSEQLGIELDVINKLFTKLGL